MSIDSASPPPAPRRSFFGSQVPGPIASPIIALCLLAIVVVRLLGYAEDQPYLLDDPAIRNLIVLVSGFIIVATVWVWFCFFSEYQLVFRRVGFVAALLLIVGIGVVIALLGVTRSVHFSGSMIPRLVSAEAQLKPITDRQRTASIDLATTTPHDFPQFLGPQRSCWIPGPKLARDWGTQPPKLLWKRPIGPGWSAFSAVNGFAVTMEQRGDDEWVVCYEIATGEPVWGHSIKARHENVLGGVGPRSTPTIHEGRVYVLGATGVIRCLDGATGSVMWKDDLRKRYGVSDKQDEANVMWGRAASPLVVDGQVIVPGGGPTGKAKNLVAFDAQTGKLLWEAENKSQDGTADQIAYPSPSLATLAGGLQILIVNEKSASGHDPQTGERLWSHDWPGKSNGDANCSQAVAVSPNRVLLTKGYSAGAELIELSPGEGATQFVTRTVWRVPRVLQTKLTNVVIHGDYLYGLSEGILECVELASGRRKWKSGRYGHGQILGVGDLLLVVSEEGELHLVESNPARFVHLSSLQAIEGKTWNNLCLYGNQLLVRNAEEAACYELPVEAE